MFFSVIPQMAIADDINTEYISSVEYDVISQLDILPETVVSKIRTDENITKAEFAAILGNIFTFVSKNSGLSADGAWKSEFFGNYSMEETAMISKTKYAYSDVDSSTDYYDDIMFVTSMGLLVPESDVFMPDEEIVYVDCLEPLLKLLGASAYVNANGGYPNGVAAYGRRLNIYSKNNAEKMGVYDICKLLYSVLDKKMIDCEYVNQRFVYKESDVTFSEKWLELTVVKGIMTDNGISALGGESTDKAVINSEEFDCDLNCDKFLGLNVKAYVSVNGDKKLYAIEENGKNNIITIDADDFTEYNNFKITYSVGNKEKSIKLKEKSFLIYNGKNKALWDSSDFEFADGNIRIVQNGSDYDVVLAENYSNVFVSNFDSKNNIIYNKAQDNILDNGDEYYDLTDAAESGKLYIEYKDKRTASLSDIKSGVEIDLILNGDYAKLILSDESNDSITVKSINNSITEKYMMISDGENDYKVSKSFLNAMNTVNIEIGKSYTAYFNRNGIIVWLVLKSSTGDNVGYYIKGYLDDDNEEYVVKLLGENGIISRFYTVEKISYTDENGNTDKVNSDTVRKRLNDYSGVITYKTDSENKIKTIILPQKKITNNGRLNLIYDCGTSLLSCKNGTLTTFKNAVFASAATKVFVVPSSEDFKNDDSSYRVDNKSNLFMTDQQYSITAYAVNGASRVADYIVYKMNADEEMEYRSSSLKFILVNDIISTLDADDEPCKMITGKIFGNNTALADVTYYAKYDKTDKKGNPVTALDIAYDMPKSKNSSEENKTYEIQKGDIIRVVLDRDGSTIKLAELFYGINRENPEFPDGRKGYLMGTRSDLTAGNDRYTNPLAINYNTGNLNQVSSWTGGMKVYCGFVYDFIDGVMELTTKDLSVSSYHDRENPAYLTEWRPYMSNTLITSVGKSFSVSAGSQGDIKTFKECGGKCSKVIMISIDMQERIMIVINDE